MADLGDPASYMTLEPGASVYARDETRIGVVTHVLAEPDLDVFDGLVMETDDHEQRFADADVVAAVFTKAVVLTIDAADTSTLPIPTAQAASMSVGADDLHPEGPLRAKLRRAWDLISGNY